MGLVPPPVYSPTVARAAEFAAMNHVAKYYWDMDAMLADPEIDCIYLAVPNSLHFPYAKKALMAGKHVICEKPFVTSRKEAEELFRTAEENGVVLMEAITVVHMPNFSLLKEWVKEIGPVKLVNYNFSRYSSVYDVYKSGKVPNVFNPEFCGGTLMDINIYNLHPVVALFGIPEKAEYFCRCGYNGIDLSGIALLQYEGFLCTCMGAKDCNGGSDGLIEGEYGYIKILEAGNICGTMELHLNNGEVRLAEHDSSTNRMNEEVKELVRLCETGDREAYESWKKETLDVMETVDMLRK